MAREVQVERLEILVDGSLVWLCLCGEEIPREEDGPDGDTIATNRQRLVRCKNCERPWWFRIVFSVGEPGEQS